MREIWKFPVAFPSGESPSFHVHMPKGTEILTVQAQKGIPQMWGMIDRGAPLEERKFAVYGTGHPIDEEKIKKYIGSFQLHNESFIFHVFEVKFI